MRGEDIYWRKAKIAARILLKSQTRPLNERDRRLARQLAAEPGVTNRLLNQAVSSGNRLGFARRSGLTSSFERFADATSHLYHRFRVVSIAVGNG